MVMSEFNQKLTATVTEAFALAALCGGVLGGVGAVIGAGGSLLMGGDPLVGARMGAECFGTIGGIAGVITSFDNLKP